MTGVCRYLPSLSSHKKTLPVSNGRPTGNVAKGRSAKFESINVCEGRCTLENSSRIVEGVSVKCNGIEIGVDVVLCR